MSAPKGFFLEELSVGQTATFAKKVTEDLIRTFAEVCGDHNPVHLDAEFAKTTIFKERIAHGMLGASFISTAIGVHLPGPGTIYLGQNLKFKAPVKINDTVTAKVEVISIDMEKRRATLKTTATVGDTVVIEGDALVMVPSNKSK
ncbi:MAG: MaoC family dehydratase [Holosporales bacterium]|jgi:3-hydroxybutyryl-CoA dehydratase